MKKAYKIITLGDSSVGKTSIVEAYVNCKFSPVVEPTLGACFYKKDITFKNRQYSLEIWDTAGQERYRSLLKLYYRNCDAVIIVFDISNRRSFQRVKDWIAQLQDNCETIPSIVLVGNKTDLIDEEKVSYEEAKGMLKSGWGFVYSSAKQQRNIDSIFQKVIELVVSNDQKKVEEKQKKLERDMKLKREKSVDKKKKQGCC